MLRMGRSTKRAPRSSRILEHRERTTTQYLEGAEGHPSRCREFSTAASRPQCLLTRRQPRSLSYYYKPNLTVTGKGRTTMTFVILTRHKSHQRTGTLHLFGSQRMGRKAQSTPRQRRQEDRPGSFCGARLEVMTTLYRSFRVCAHKHQHLTHTRTQTYTLCVSAYLCDKQHTHRVFLAIFM
jgi:hypothetical protein